MGSGICDQGLALPQEQGEMVEEEIFVFSPPLPKKERPWNEFRDAFRKAHPSHLTTEGGFPAHRPSTRAPKSALQKFISLQDRLLPSPELDALQFKTGCPGSA